MLIQLERSGWRVEGEREVQSGIEGMCMANTDCRHFVDTHHLLACISCVVKQNVLRFNLYICRNNKLAQSSEIEFSIQVMTFKILLHDTTLLTREKTNVTCCSLKLLSYKPSIRSHNLTDPVSCPVHKMEHISHSQNNCLCQHVSLWQKI